jgi:hypothetical protein
VGEPRLKTGGRQWARRIGIAFLVGATLAATAILAAWREFAQSNLINRQVFVRGDLERMRNVLETYLNDNGTLPPKLPEPSEAKWVVFRTDGNDSAVDGWGHPLIYEHDGNSFNVITLGRDGKPGGAGLDCDLSTTAPQPPGSFPTLEQFVCEMSTGEIIASCGLGGVFAFVLTLVSLRAPRQGAEKPAIIAVKIVFTFIAAAFVAGFMAVAHLANKSGH